MPAKKASAWTASLPKLVVLAVFGAGVVLIGSRIFAPEGNSVDAPPTGSGEPAVLNVVVPPNFSRLAADGGKLFDRSCSSCHGQDASGTNKGPPLVHDLYNPGHHSDEAFVVAAQRGVPAHHWPFGNMPPRPEVTEAQVRAIARYVRELQAANGIITLPHTM